MPGDYAAWLKRASEGEWLPEYVLICVCKRMNIYISLESNITVHQSDRE